MAFLDIPNVEIPLFKNLYVGGHLFGKIQVYRPSLYLSNV